MDFTIVIGSAIVGLLLFKNFKDTEKDLNEHNKHGERALVNNKSKVKDFIFEFFFFFRICVRLLLLLVKKKFGTISELKIEEKHTKEDPNG